MQKLLQDWLKEQPVTKVIRDLIFDWVYLSYGDADLLIDIYVEDGKLEPFFDEDIYVHLALVVDAYDQKENNVTTIEQYFGGLLFSHGYRIIPFDEDYNIKLFVPIISGASEEINWCEVVRDLHIRIKRGLADGSVVPRRFYEEDNFVWCVVRQEV